MPSIPQIAQIVYDTARAGTAVNPGLPAFLADAVVTQTKFETAKEVNGVWMPFASNVAVQDNNLLGYKWVGSRYQTGPGLQSPEGDYYGKYATMADSIKELVDWIYRRRAEGKFPENLESIKTLEQYAIYLKNSGYYGVSVEKYLVGLKKWFQSMTMAQKTGIAGIMIAITIGWLLLFNRRKS